MYHPTESAVAEALADLQKARDRAFSKFMSDPSSTQDFTLNQAGIVPEPGESRYSLACRYVDANYPETHFPGAGQPSPTFPNSVNTFQTARAPHDMREYRDMIDTVSDMLDDTDEENKGEDQKPTGSNGGFYHTFMLPGLSYVGYRSADQYGTVKALPVTEILNISGMNNTDPKAQSSFVIIDLSSFFDADYVKQTIFQIYADLAGEMASNTVLEYVEEFILHQGWMPEADAFVDAATKKQTPTWEQATAAVQSRPTDLGESDAATEIIQRYPDEGQSN